MTEHFVYRLRVRYREVDPNRIVFHSHYYSWFDSALREFARERCKEFAAPGPSPRGLAQSVVREIVMCFVSPARFEDEIQIEVELAKLDEAELVWALTASREHDLLVEARLVHGYMDPADGSPQPIPVAVREELAPLLSAGRQRGG